jgi:uncharacterized protein
MQWIGRRESENVEDRRGMSGGGKIAAGGGFIGIVIVLLQLFGGENAQMLTPILEQMNNNQTEQVSNEPLSAEDEEMGKFVRVCLADNEDVWTAVFKQNGMEYEKPKLVLFRGAVETACGGASAASGPFYCPGDHKLYMDMSFFDDLKNRFGAKGGDFAISYVISHEIGHHVQTLLGTSNKMRDAQQGKSDAEANKLSVALELQADFYAGIVAHNQQQILDDGDIEEALSAANAVGDDAIQSKMQGQVIPDSFTHGSSKQRMFWFNKGYTSGDIRQGNTFEGL